MAVAQGSNFKLYVKSQTDPEVMATGNYDQVPVAGNFSLAVSQELQRDDLLSAGIGRDGGDPYLDVLTVQGGGDVPFDTVHIGRWLRPLLGPAVTTGTTDFTHVWKSGAATLPTLSIEKAFPEVPAFEKFLGVHVNSMSLDLAPSGPANASVALLGLGGSVSTTSGAGTPVFTQSQRMMRPTATISKDGSPLQKVTAGSMELSNNMQAVRTIRADNRIDSIDLGQFTCGGQLTVRFADTALMTQAVAGTPLALSYGFSISATKSILFEMPRVFLSRPGISVSGPMGVDLPVQWQAAYSDADGCMVRVTLKNAVAAYS